jgi:hypothetical protein
MGYNTAAIHNTFRGNRVKMIRGGDNLAAIVLENTRPDFAVIEGNVINGPGNDNAIHANTSTIYLRRIKNVKIIGNILSDAPIGIYYKHATEAGTQADTDIEIAYNYISNTRRNAVQFNLNRAYIHDNIFGAGNASVIFAEANGTSGGDYNRLEHNTFFQTSVSLTAQNGGSDTCPGSCGNTLRDNIFWGAVGIHNGQTWPHGTSMDYNWHGASAAVREFTTNYSLSAWRKRNGDSANSISGSIKFKGGKSPSTIAGFSLPDNSPGKGAASDGMDMGANVSLVGQGSAIQPGPPEDVN